MLWKILKRLQQPSMWVKLAITRERSFSLLTHESKSKRTWLEAVSFRCIATVEQLQLEQTHTHTYTHTHTHTHTQSASLHLWLHRPSCGYASRHKKWWPICRQWLYAQLIWALHALPKILATPCTGSGHCQRIRRGWTFPERNRLVGNDILPAWTIPRVLYPAMVKPQGNIYFAGGHLASSLGRIVSWDWSP